VTAVAKHSLAAAQCTFGPELT